MKRNVDNHIRKIVNENINKFLKENLILEYMEDNDSDRLREIIEELVEIRNRFERKVAQEDGFKCANHTPEVLKLTNAINELIVATDKIDTKFVPYGGWSNIPQRGIENRRRHPEEEFGVKKT